MEKPRAAAVLWGHGHLPLLARARSKESVEYILEALWRTRRTGLDAADRAAVRDILQIPSDAELDPLLVCLRILIRRCVHESVRKEEICKLFPEEVSPELQRLLTLLLQKFQPEWREDASKDQGNEARLLTPVPNSESTECRLNQNEVASEQIAVASLKLQNGTESTKNSLELGEKEVKPQLVKDSLYKMLKDMYSIKDQPSNVVSIFHGNPNSPEEPAGST